MRRTLGLLMEVPGWRTMSSTLETRTREKREEDRKKRQLEKLPCPELLWSPQYGLQKTVLCDHWFQPRQYSDALDTPHLFHSPHHVPHTFFMRVSMSDFRRTSYPEIPQKDYRGFTSEQWNESEEKKLAPQYLRKHGIVPEFFPCVENDVNFSVLHEEVADHPGRSTFWRSPHFGNYIEAKHLQQPARIYLPKDGNLYALLIVSPDYPFRTKSDTGFLLHGLQYNLRGEGINRPCVGSTTLPYLPPLPTEDAGTYRVLYVLFRQTKELNIRPLPTDEKELFALRRDFRLHAKHNSFFDEDGLAEFPSAIRMLCTVWDLNIARWYERVGIPEPSYIPEDTYAEILSYAESIDADKKVKSRIRFEGGIVETAAIRQKYLPAVHYFTVPMLSEASRKPEQGLPYPNPM